MHFSRKLSYLGVMENVLKDGTKFYKVSMLYSFVMWVIKKIPMLGVE